MRHRHLKKSKLTKHVGTVPAKHAVLLAFIASPPSQAAPSAIVVVLSAPFSVEPDIEYNIQGQGTLG
jgi:hypothetical protein